MKLVFFFLLLVSNVFASHVCTSLEEFGMSKQEEESCQLELETIQNDFVANNKELIKIKEKLEYYEKFEEQLNKANENYPKTWPFNYCELDSAKKKYKYKDTPKNAKPLTDIHKKCFNDFKNNNLLTIERYKNDLKNKSDEILKETFKSSNFISMISDKLSENCQKIKCANDGKALRLTMDSANSESENFLNNFLLNLINTKDQNIKTILKNEAMNFCALINQDTLLRPESCAYYMDTVYNKLGPLFDNITSYDLLIYKDHLSTFKEDSIQSCGIKMTLQNISALKFFESLLQNSNLSSDQIEKAKLAFYKKLNKKSFNLGDDEKCKKAMLDDSYNIEINWNSIEAKSFLRKCMNENFDVDLEMVYSKIDQTKIVSDSIVKCSADKSYIFDQIIIENERIENKLCSLSSKVLSSIAKKNNKLIAKDILELCDNAVDENLLYEQSKHLNYQKVLKTKCLELYNNLNAKGVEKITQEVTDSKVSQETSMVVENESTNNRPKLTVKELMNRLDKVKYEKIGQEMNSCIPTVGEKVSQNRVLYLALQNLYSDTYCDIDSIRVEGDFDIYKPLKPRKNKELVPKKIKPFDPRLNYESCTIKVPTNLDFKKTYALVKIKKNELEKTFKLPITEKILSNHDQILFGKDSLEGLYNKKGLKEFCSGI